MTTPNAQRVSHSAQVPEQHGSNAASKDDPRGLHTLQAMAASSPATTSLMQRQALADTAGSGVVIQRTVNTAAQAFLDRGFKSVKKNDIDGQIRKDHGVTKANAAAIDAQLQILRAAAPARAAPAQVDMTVNTNWPTGQVGMIEGEAAVVAGVNGWWETGSDFSCAGHNPNGKVYTDGTHFFGADNTGHSGWGFKVWLAGKKPSIKVYAGNYNWNGAAWVHDDRGTGKTM